MKVALTRYNGMDSLKQALDAIDAWEAFKPGMNVLIKPNAVMGGSPKIPSRGITASATVVEAVVKLVREKGAGSVIIGEGSVELPSLKLDTAAAFAWSGLEKLGQTQQVPLVDLNKGPHREFTLSDGTPIEIAEAVFEADFLINVPVLKTHNQTLTTICLKNLKGCLSMESKKRCHTETDLNKAIAEFNRMIPCQLNVVDALTATEIGPTPTGKADQVRDMGLVMAGKDRLACDVAGSYLLGYDAAKVRHIALYAEMTGADAQYRDVEIVGEDPADYRMELDYYSTWAEDLMEKYAVSGLRMPFYGDKLCSACGFNLWAGLMQFCRGNQGKHFAGTQLCAGEDVEPDAEVRYNILLGKCSIEKYKNVEGVVKVPGCPPDPAKLAEKLEKALKEQP